MLNPFCDASSSKKRKGCPTVVSNNSSDVYQPFLFYFFKKPSTFLHRELVEGPETPIKKRLRKATPPGSDNFKMLDEVSFLPFLIFSTWCDD